MNSDLEDEWIFSEVLRSYESTEFEFLFQRCRNLSGKREIVRSWTFLHVLHAVQKWGKVCFRPVQSVQNVQFWRKSFCCQTVRISLRMARCFKYNVNTLKIRSAWQKVGPYFCAYSTTQQHYISSKYIPIWYVQVRKCVISYNNCINLW